MMTLDICYPPLAMALTSGPTQPEFQKFTPASATDMVNIFSGDMAYNIPLFELPGPNGGYPFNLSYTSGITMEQEASWVGLGWDLNAGAMNRSMRGVPDEFDGEKGDNITVREDVKKNFTVGLSYSPDFEIFSKDVVSLGSVSLFYNNYKGIGYSIGFGVNVKAFSTGNGAKGSLGLDVTLNTQEGVDLSPNLSLSRETDDMRTTVNFSASFNSLQGYKGLGFSIQAEKMATKMVDMPVTEEAKDGKDMFTSQNIMESKSEDENTYTPETAQVPVKYVEKSTSSAFSFGYNATPSVSPSINSETQGFAANLNVKIGAEVFGGNPNIQASGFYRQEQLVHKNVDVDYPVFGYNNSGKAVSKKRALMDFNREADGAINKYTKSLAIPNYTYDTWSITGQGIGQMVRPYKSYIGFVRDPYRESKINNFSVGVEIGSGNLIKVGGSVGYSYSASKSGGWGTYAGESTFESVYGNSNVSDVKYEPYYYKVHGETGAFSADEFLKNTAGTSPMKLHREIRKNSIFKRSDQDIHPFYYDKSGNRKTLDHIKKERTPRSNYLLEVKNEDINKEDPIFKEFKIKYYENLNKFETPVYFERTGKAHHLAGFVAYKNDGLRYVYALPIINKKHIESSFSIKVTNGEKINGGNGNTIYRDDNGSEQELYKKGGQLSSQRLNITKTPEYPHCFPLTAMLGVDYVDVKNDGITDDDLGYWVKFGYYKDAIYKWRMPYNGMNYIPGQLSTVTDDMASYVYGERESYFLQTAETKTHIAKFYLKKRLDNLEAAGQGSFGSDDKGVNGGYAIEKIELFSKAELKANPIQHIPIKTIYFEYDYSLCSGIKNKKAQEAGHLNALGEGKLTLKKVWFKYRNNDRATHNYYEFDYNQGQNEGEYDPYAQDVWGTYKKPDNGQAQNRLFPYVDQTKNKATQDKNAAMWNLNKIKLPSGSIIELEYEMDDYAYVQNKPAMQLYKIDAKSELDISRGLYFQLTEPYKKPTGVTDPSAINSNTSTNEHMRSFLDNSGYVFFKVKIDLLNKGNDEEYVSGYGQVDLSDNTSISIDASSYDAGKDAYTRGYIQFKEVKLKGKTLNDHPISIAAWNYFQLNRPELMGKVGDYEIPKEDDADPSKKEMRSALLSLVNPFKGMAVFINGFYGTCRNRGYGKNLDVSDSYIRLNSKNERTEIIDTDRKIENFKYGGGHRIKKVILKENDSSSPDDIVGVVYDYTINEGGKWTSSGVATYEPSLGGEENALKLPLEFEVDVKLKTNYKLYAEKPFNQSLYPGASVGYRQVTVRSYATDKVLSKQWDNQIPTTGQTVYQFYTAKDFPVITDYTTLTPMKTDKSETFYAYLYNYTFDYFMATQGYSIELNDMHGKPKSIEAFQISKEGIIVNVPISGTYYNYKAKKISNINGYDGWQLINEGIDVMDENGKLHNNYIVGLDYEVINDTRESISVGYNGSLDLNLDGMLIVFPIGFPFVMPNASVSESIVQTAVTNKVFYRSGLIDETVQMTDGAQVSTKAKVLDKLTGLPIIQIVKNEFGNTLETSSYPAYWHYSEMGPVYKRIGVKGIGNVSVVVNQHDPNKFLLSVRLNNKDYRIGDELSVKCTVLKYPISQTFHRKGTVVSKSENQMEIDVTGLTANLNGASGLCELYLYRPIDRNQLDVMIGSKTVLK